MVFLSLAGRCFYLQFFRSDYYHGISTKQYQGQVTQKPKRGVILDCCGRVLAASNKIHSIFAEPRIIKDPKTTSTKLAEVLDIGAHEICKLITESKNPGFVKIKTGVKSHQRIAASRIYGIGVQSDWQRHYPMGPLAGHVIGFTSVDNRGLGGIELQFDKELRGLTGHNIFLADAFRRPVRLEQQSGVLCDGVGIILTLDAAIQEFVRAELLKQYKSYEAESAIAIVAEAATGAILAMVSLPDFNPADIRSAEPNNFRNRTITDQFEPGSMMKPIVAAIALDTDIVNTDEKIFCENGNYYGKGFGRIHEYRDHRFGNLTVRDILIKSSNIGMAKIGQRIGKDKLYTELRRFGFGRKTGIGLSGEAEGLLRPVNQWSGYSVTRIPYGYEISVTAIQMVRTFCMLANGGYLVEPFLVRAIIDEDGEIIKLKKSTPPVGFVLNPEVAKWIVQKALVGVVNEQENGGTGWRAQLERWQVFGKTGTANIAKVGQKGYFDRANIASFVGGAPAEEPAVVVFVSIRKPNSRLGKGDSGGVVAAPVAGRILEKTLNYLEKYRR